MRTVISKCASLVKGKKILIDENIPISYLLIIIKDYLLGLIRGVVTFGIKSKGKMFVRGEGVKIFCRSKLTIANNVRFGGKVHIDALSKQGIRIGNNVTLGPNNIIKCTGSFDNIGEGLKIGNNFGSGENCFFGAAGGIEIGNDVIMGQSVRFHAQNHNFKDVNKLIREQSVTQKGIIIGNDCWIGSGVVFLDGVIVGNGCVIGANSIVNKNIPDCSIAVGNPVRIVKKRID